MNNYANLKQMRRQLNIFVQITKLLFGVSLCDLKTDQNQSQLLASVHQHWINSQTSPVVLLEVVYIVLNTAFYQI